MHAGAGSDHAPDHQNGEDDHEHVGDYVSDPCCWIVSVVAPHARYSLRPESFGSRLAIDQAAAELKPAQDCNGRRRPVVRYAGHQVAPAACPLKPTSARCCPVAGPGANTSQVPFEFRSSIRWLLRVAHGDLAFVFGDSVWPLAGLWASCPTPSPPDRAPPGGFIRIRIRLFR